MEKHFDRTVNTAPCVVTTCRFDARDADTLRTFDSDRNNKDNQVQVTMAILILQVVKRSLKAQKRSRHFS